MSKTTVSLERNSFRLWYYRYKDSVWYTVSFAVIIFVFSIILFIVFVRPQISEWFSVRREVSATQAKITSINQNLRYLSSVNTSDVDDKYQTALHALPPNDDIFGILNAITASTLSSNVSVGEYSIAPDANAKNADQSMHKIDIDLSVAGSLDGVQTFLSKLTQKVPIIQINSVNYSPDGSKVSISFYSKLLPKVTVDRTEDLQKVADANNALISQLKDWDNQTSSIDTLPISASASSSLGPPF